MDQTIKNADWYYHHPDYGYNCAQAIAHCWTGDAGMVKAMEKCGSGRALDGYCGAIHAARIVASNLNLDVPTLEERFAQQAGSLKCREIRSLRNLSCRQCVEVAHNVLDSLLRERLEQNNGR